MKTKDLKNKLNAEIKASTPDVYDRVVESSYIEKPLKETTAKKRVNVKRLATSLVTCCMVLAIVITGVVFFTTRTVSNATSVTVDINPSFTMTANSKNVIETARANNEDAETVLAYLEDNGISLKGKTLAEGTKLFVEASAKLGFIEVNMDAELSEEEIVITTAAKKNGADINGDISAAVTAYLKQNGIYAAVETSVLTKEQLLAKVKQFDKNATSQDTIAELNARLARRKSIIEEEIDAVTTSIGKSIEMYKIYAETALTSINNLISVIEERKAAFQTFTVAETAEAKRVAKDEILKLLDIETISDEGVALLKTAYDNIPLETIKAARDNVNAAMIMFVNVSNQVMDLIAGIKTSVASISIPEFNEYFTAVPETVAELAEYFKTICAQNGEKLFRQYEENYNEQRVAISDEDYSAFMKRFRERKGR